MKTVSVLIPCHNAERWLARAIESALAQTHVPLEVIVADDGSTDRSPAIAASFAPRVRLIEGPHRGGGATRNLLLEAARGEWLQYLDADDYLLPDKIDRQVWTAAGTAADVVYSPMRLRDEPTQTETVYEGATGDPLVDYIRWGPFQTSAMLWRREAVVAAGGWKTDQPVCQEHELILRLLRRGARFAFSPGAHTVYRRHGAPSVSRRDPLATIRRRMALTDEFESWLAAEDRLSRELRRELYVARMESARSSFAYDPKYACLLYQRARRAGFFFCVNSAALPLAYRLVLFAFGFGAAERLAQGKRRLRAAARMVITSTRSTGAAPLNAR